MTTQPIGVWRGHPLARVAAILSALVAVLVLAGSIFDSSALTTIVPAHALGSGPLVVCTRMSD